MRTRPSTRSREPIDSIWFSRWACRGAAAVAAVLAVLLLARLLGWTASDAALLVALPVTFIAAIVVYVRFWSLLRLTYPSTPTGEHRDGPGETPPPAGWSSWSIPRRAEATERARRFRELTETLKRGGPIAATDRAQAGAHAYRQVAASTTGAVTGALLCSNNVSLLADGDGFGTYFFSGSLLVSVVLLVFNYRGARQWRRIAINRDLVDPPREA